MPLESFPVAHTPSGQFIGGKFKADEPGFGRRHLLTRLGKVIKPSCQLIQLALQFSLPGFSKPVDVDPFVGREHGEMDRADPNYLSIAWRQDAD
jgi:hypothetical protein